MDLTQIRQEAEALKEARRQEALVVWKDAITKALASCLTVTNTDIQNIDPIPARRWISFVGNEARLETLGSGGIVEGSPLEAWCDSEGVLDIEVPGDIARDLKMWVEAAGMRCGIENISQWFVILHINTLLPPFVPEA